MYDDWDDYIGYATKPDHVKLSKLETNYREAGEPDTDGKIAREILPDGRIGRPLLADGLPAPRCYDCRFYGWGTCHLVEGTIEADDVCDLYKPAVQTVPGPALSMYAAVGVDVGSYALFQPFAYAADGADGAASPVLPEWFDYYPAPSRFMHDLYGEIVITPDGNRAMVDNFNAAVFQDRIPIDCEHDLESSGAVGWITEMRIGDRGQVEAKAEWNDRGTALLTGDRFRYFSPHLWPTWKEPVNQTEFINVAIGGAICVRPFFNQNHLLPLVATADGGIEMVRRAERAQPVAATPGSSLPGERSVSVITLTPVSLRQHEEEVPVMGNEPEVTPGANPVVGTTPAPVKPEAPQFSQADVQAFQAFIAAGGATAFTALQQKAEAQEQTIANLRNNARQERFKNMVLGKDGPDEGAPWQGSVEHNVSMLEHLADTSGEDSDLFAAHLEVQRSAAQTAATATTFSEVGSSKRRPLATSAIERQDQLVEQFKAAGMDERDALSKVAREHRDVYEAAVEEMSERV